MTITATPTPFRARPKAPRATVVGHWSTPLWIGTVTIPLAREDMASRLAHLEGPRTVLAAERILDDTYSVADTLTRLGARASGAQCTRTDLSVELWQEGYRVPLDYGAGMWRSWTVLAAFGQEPHPDHGALTFHDPRAGCDGAFVPGLPWGRALTVRPAAAITVVAPSWVGASVLPVAADQRFLVLRATGHMDTRPTADAAPGTVTWQPPH